MGAAVVEDRIAELDRKLDFIVEELSHLRRIRNSAEDLVADLTIVGKDAMGDAVEALGSTTLRPQELAHLVKTVLQDARLLTSTLQQLESAADFVQDAQPIVRDLFRQAVAGCQTMQERGYFKAAAAGMGIGDSLVQSHSSNDWKQVEASVPQLVGFLRELTHPEVLQALEAIIHGFGRVQATMNVNKSVFEILRDLNSSDARRGISILVEYLKVLGSSSVTAGLAGTSAAVTPER
jgi:uncharacterized protein YjgD (DUF1641 family)